MEKKTYTLNTLLAGILGVFLLAEVLVCTFAPAVILPELDIPNMVLISLIALLADHYLAPGAKRCYICIPVFSAITFGLLPFAACLAGAMEALKLALIGGIVFTVITWLFTSMTDRLSSGPAAKASPVICSLCLYLAAQALMSI